ncbi:MAG: thermonuclease family protein [Oceanospirillales bacterium]|nr:thermonuclease family protein [Oceanospirillales bacterium]
MPVSAWRDEVVKVIDGDTLRLAGGDTVRLIGVNTPELGREGRRDQEGAWEATQYLRQWVLGQLVEVVPGVERRDRYGRLLAHVGLQGVSLSERLIEHGLGVAVAIAPNVRLSDCLFEAERRAREAGVGLWRSDPVRPAGEVRSGGFALLRGRVTQIDLTSKAVYVELDDYLVLRVERKRLDAKEQVWLHSLKGVMVEVRGWVIDRGEQIGAGRKRWLIGISDLRHVKTTNG